MDNFDKLLKLATKRFGKSVFIVTDDSNYTYEWTCGAYGESNLETMQDLYESISQELYKYWLSNELMGLDDKKPAYTIENRVKTIESDENGNVLKTRIEWSKGKAGDPRKPQSKNAKYKRFTKTQVVNFMRQATNGRFSNEKITFEQYAQEFKVENKKAEGRRHWQRVYGKGKVTDGSRIQKVRG